MGHYFQRGGLRWGNTFWRGCNATWPFATLHATSEFLHISVGLGPLRRRFDFAREEVKTVRLKRALFSIGLQVEHVRTDYPPFILFWTFGPRRLRFKLKELGYSFTAGWGDE
ncbi:MAG TPA: hypothetical protein VHX86_05705 [Tepidisphaeraceae bacterium]|jgi:hypothetical protein|nr:hypothetical protein [Tepidisphaeraceae bacterium]